MNRARAWMFTIVGAGALAPEVGAQVTQAWTHAWGGPGGDTSRCIAFGVGGSAYLGGGALQETTSGTHSDAILMELGADSPVGWGASVQGDTMQYFRTFTVAVSPVDGSVYSAYFSSIAYWIQVLKHTSAGVAIWTAPQVYPASEPVRTMLLDAAENLYLATTGGSGAHRDMMLRSYSSAGALRFETPVDFAGGHEHARALALDAAGDVILAGVSESGFTVVSKVSSSGAVAWAHPNGAGNNVQAIACDATGHSYVLIDHDTVFQYDGNGFVVWSVGAPAGVTLDDLVAHGAAGVVAAGSDTAGQLVAVHFGDPGTVAWDRRWSSPAHSATNGRFARIDRAGNVLVAGTATASGVLRNFAYASYTPNGDLRWAGTGNTAPVELVATDAAVGADGDFAITGEVTVSNQTQNIDGFTQRWRAQSTGFCFGDGSAAPCPCGNTSAPGDQRGCVNSAGNAARLTDAGIASIGSDSLVLTSSGETPLAASLFVQGNAAVGAVSFGDGLRCVGGSMKRLYTRNASAGSVSAPIPGEPSISARSALLGDTLAIGSRRLYQVHYRDPSPAFCPAPSGSTWNMSGGLVVVWSS